MGGYHTPTAFGAPMTVAHLVGVPRTVTTTEAALITGYFGVAPAGYLPMPDAPGSYYDPADPTKILVLGHTVAEFCDVTLQEIEEDIADRCRVPLSKVDFSALADIVVPGFLVGQQAPGKRVLEPLMLGFFHDLPELDGQIVARLRGGATDFDITVDQLLMDGRDDETVRPQALEFPGKVHVFTQEPEANYQAVPQTSARFSPDVDVSGEVTVNLAIPFDADTAMKIAVKVHQAAWCQAEATAGLSLPPDFATMVASDTFNFDNRRWLCTKTDYADGALKVEAVYERASIYDDPDVSGQAPTPPTPPGGLVKGPTLFIAANLPALRAEDNVPGVYVFGQGQFEGHPGFDLYLDDTLVATITRQSVMGLLSEDEPDAGEPITVRLFNTSDELENATSAEVVNGKNAAIIIDADDNAEIIGFENATQTSNGDWELDTITREGLGTYRAQHLTGERFTLLENATFIPVPIERQGETLVFRAVTIGTPVDSNATTELVYDPSVGMTIQRVDDNGDFRIDTNDDFRITRYG
jgi:hypothetical protein